MPRNTSDLRRGGVAYRKGDAHEMNVTFPIGKCYVFPYLFLHEILDLHFIFTFISFVGLLIANINLNLDLLFL
jgi:hypothetical protein